MNKKEQFEIIDNMHRESKITDKNRTWYGVAVTCRFGTKTLYESKEMGKALIKMIELAKKYPNFDIILDKWNRDKDGLPIVKDDTMVIIPSKKRRNKLL